MTLPGRPSLAGGVPDHVSALTLAQVRGTGPDTYVRDDFLTGQNASGNTGDLAWAVGGGTTTIVAAEAGHPGIIRRDTGASSGTVAFTSLRGNSGTGGTFEASDIFKVRWVFRLNQVDANTTLRVGFSSNWGSQLPTDAAFLELLGTDTNWFFNTRRSTETRTNSGVAANMSWHTLTIRRIDASTLGFMLDANAEVSVTATLPTGGALQPGLQIVNSAAASKTVDIDFFDLLITGLSR